MEWWLEAIPFRQDVPQFPSSTLLPTLSPSLFLPSSFLFVFSFFPFPTFFHWINMHCCMLSKSSKCSYFHSYPIGIFLWILKNRESHKQTSRHPKDPGKKCLETKLPVLSTHVNLEQAVSFLQPSTGTPKPEKSRCNFFKSKTPKWAKLETSQQKRRVTTRVKKEAKHQRQGTIGCLYNSFLCWYTFRKCFQSTPYHCWP